MSKKVIIVGGVAGGASTAARLRRLDEAMEIIMIERGEYISFANCGLPYYIGDVIRDRNALLVQTVEGMATKFNMDIRILSEVTRIDPQRKQIVIKNLQTGQEYQETYDKLVLSPGANPIKPPIPGIEEADNLFTLRSIPDTDAIKNFVKQEHPQSAVVIGGGFVGLEMAENLHQLGLAVTLVEMAEQVMAPLDYEMAAIVHNHLRDKKVNLILQDAVVSFGNKGRLITLQSGQELATDMVILAIGVRPENELAKAAGLSIGERGGIQVNAGLQTSEPDIYAIGDAIEIIDYINGDPGMIPLAGPANKQGRIVANNIGGKQQNYPGTLGTAVAKVFDLTVASTGNNEKLLKHKNLAYKVVHIHPGSHAGYYPGAFPIALKLLFESTSGKIFGAQAVGYTGVEKRIDVIATAIKGGLTVNELQELELSYAPPYSSAKDPINMLGFAAKNIQEGLISTFQWHEVASIIAHGGFLLDVRERAEQELGKIEGSKHIPLGQLRARLDELPRGEIIYVYCQVGIRGYLAARILVQHGFRAKNLDGGYRTYQAVFEQDQANSQAAIAIDDSGFVKQPESRSEQVVRELNVCGLQCPGPIMQVYQTIEQMHVGDCLEVTATDPGFAKDIQAWCGKMGHNLIASKFTKQGFVVTIEKGQGVSKNKSTVSLNKSTLVVFSGDLDKAIASFIIASGAAAMGKQVTMFFTFWGLNVLRKPKGPKVQKGLLEKMFGWMMPQGAGKLGLSKMNMGGIGGKMIRFIMRRKNVDSLELLMEKAQQVGVKLVACSMSMDIMGIKQEELIPGVDIGGVAHYLGEAEAGNLNLFV